MQSTHEYKNGLSFSFSFLCQDFACKFMHAYFSFIIDQVIGSPTKMAAALGMCSVFKTIVSSYQSNNTFKILKMERESFKKFSEATTV